MMYLRYLSLLVADLLVNGVSYFLDPVVVLFADPQGNLPRWLKYFQTHDATVDGIGLTGGIEPRFVRQTKFLRDENGNPKNRACRYLCRVAWLYRNNAYGFGYYVTGAVGPFAQTRSRGDTLEPPTNRYPARNGYRLEEWRSADRRYFHLWWVREWGFGKCWEANIGWKINKYDSRAQFVFRVWPFRSFETKSV